MITAMIDGQPKTKAPMMVIVGTGLWVLYRVIRGWMALLDRSAMPVPEA